MAAFNSMIQQTAFIDTVGIIAAFLIPFIFGSILNYFILNKSSILSQQNNRKTLIMLLSVTSGLLEGFLVMKVIANSPLYLQLVASLA
ncbi:hypothetical protein [Candidatus Nanohalovita haloferacivicina]|uniref:hypothetical protein n=1 Tax=Candidatus Nanohalovita haloferacivicina TaxID=2978046 RepID=UPI00325FC61C|nr:hypothetical protein HBNXNv_0102 [Candidatus Nanohalobia archaeon BNXNv]